MKYYEKLHEKKEKAKKNSKKLPWYDRQAAQKVKEANRPIAPDRQPFDQGTSI